MTRFPQPERRGLRAFGSATLAFSKRYAAGSVFTSEDVEVAREDVKTFAFRGNQHGSWFIDVKTPFGWMAYAEGTFPASAGSVTSRSFREMYEGVRARVRPTVTGSFSVFLGVRSVHLR